MENQVMLSGITKRIEEMSNIASLKIDAAVEIGHLEHAPVFGEKALCDYTEKVTGSVIVEEIKEIEKIIGQLLEGRLGLMNSNNFFQ